jgi:hypothetical protein
MPAAFGFFEGLHPEGLGDVGDGFGEAVQGGGARVESYGESFPPGKGEIKHAKTRGGNSLMRDDPALRLFSNYGFAEVLLASELPRMPRLSSAFNNSVAV